MDPWHATLSQPMVNRIVWICAEEWGCSFFDARFVLADRWEQMAREARADGRASWLMYDEMGLMALQAVRP